MFVDIQTLLLISVVGLFLGLLGGMLGIGSGLMGLPFLSFLGFDFTIARLACVCNNIVISGSAVAKHLRAGRKFLGYKFLIMGTFPGIFVGYGVYSLDNKEVLWVIYCLSAVLIMFFFLTKRKQPCDDIELMELPCSPTKFAAVGSFAGFFAVTLGIGGGGIMVPFLTRWCKLSLKQSIVISSATIIFSSITALILAYISGGHHWNLIGIKVSLIMLPGMIVGGYFGGDLGQKLSNTLLKIAFCIIILIGLYRGIEKIIDYEKQKETHQRRSTPA